jgi:hypothetical protein
MNAPAKSSLILAIALIASPFITHAQSAQPAQPDPTVAQVAPAPASAPAAASDAAPTVTLKEGTEVPLVFATSLSSKTAVDGDPVSLSLAEDLKVGEVVVAHKGAAALGTVTNAKKSGVLGRPGDLAIRLEYVKAGDQRIKIRGAKGKEGDARTGTTAVVTVLAGPVGLLIHGHNVEIPEGSAVTAFVDQDYPLPVAR